MKLYILTLSLIIITGCASTQYQAKNYNGGFSETHLSKDIYRVNFYGNTYTTPEQAADFSLLRCADLAIENGFQYFQIINEKAESKSDSFYIPPTTYNYSSGYSYTTGGFSGNSSSPISTFTIKFTNDADIKGAFDALFIARSIESKYADDKAFTKARISLGKLSRR